MKEIHGIFVTGLDFMPVSDSAKAVTGENDFTLLSVSADNTVRVHQEPSRSKYENFWMIIVKILSKKKIKTASPKGRFCLHSS